jgi:hypothetical protein
MLSNLEKEIMILEPEQKSKELFLKLVMHSSDMTFPPLIFLEYLSTVKGKKVKGWTQENLKELSSLNQQLVDKGLMMFAQSIMHAYANYLINNDDNIIANYESLKDVCNKDDIMEQSKIHKERCLELLKKNNLFEKRM